MQNNDVKSIIFYLSDEMFQYVFELVQQPDGNLRPGKLIKVVFILFGTVQELHMPEIKVKPTNHQSNIFISHKPYLCTRGLQPLTQNILLFGLRNS